MMIDSINPATGQEIQSYELLNADEVTRLCQNAARAQGEWAALPIERRADLLRAVSRQLSEQQSELARLITSEMGKLIGEARAEIEKCAWVCDYYADHAVSFMADEPVDSDADRSLVAHQPLGVVLAVMPWNFPFWQAFRCAAPALMAGNGILLKHASNVPGCALILEKLFQDAGFPSSVFTTLLISSDQVAEVIRSETVQAVSLTGSEKAGRSVASHAGQSLKKSVLELGGSDAFVVLEDADLEAAAEAAVKSRFQNCGQSCIAAKRFIVVEALADAFVDKLHQGIDALHPGDPLESASGLAPMARSDLRDTLHQQVTDSIGQGAALITGGQVLPGPGWFYAPTLLDQVKPGSPAYDEEIFGPVAVVIRAEDEADALRIANDSRFGLGGCVWTADRARGEAFARRMACGCAFVNGMVKSDPRLPFGGIKHSGYGRELSRLGILEFVNQKTLWLN